MKGSNMMNLELQSILTQSTDVLSKCEELESNIEEMHQNYNALIATEIEDTDTRVSLKDNFYAKKKKIMQTMMLMKASLNTLLANSFSFDSSLKTKLNDIFSIRNDPANLDEIGNSKDCLTDKVFFDLDLKLMKITLNADAEYNNAFCTVEPVSDDMSTLHPSQVIDKLIVPNKGNVEVFTAYTSYLQQDLVNRLIPDSMINVIDNLNVTALDEDKPSTDDDDSNEDEHDAYASSLETLKTIVKIVTMITLFLVNETTNVESLDKCAKDMSTTIYKY
jgi:hypothetical protein